MSQLPHASNHASPQAATPGPQRFIAAARLHADTVLAEARDHWGRYATPLLADGLHIESRQPVTWVQHGHHWILSNPASQQNFLRLLSGLSHIGQEGDLQDYIAAAREIVTYTMRHMRFGDMLWWGGHCAADLLEKRLVFCTDGSPYPRHELERCFPFYELMNEIDPQETRCIIEKTWAMHMRDWSLLSFNRHNIANLPRRESAADADYPAENAASASIWEQVYTGGPFTSELFTFMPAGIDLVYGAAQLYHFSGDTRPLLWACRLASRYVQDAHPVTGLPGYLYNASYRPPRADGRPERHDRAASQLGLQLGRTIEERCVWMPNQIREALYCFVALIELSAMTGEPSFGQGAVQGLVAFATHAFDAADGAFHPILTDGTRLTGLVLEHEGYFGARGTTLVAKNADAPALLAFAYGYRHAPEPVLWKACQTLVQRLKLGELGPPGGSAMQLNLRCGSADALALFAVLALYQATGHRDFIDLAERIGDNIIAKRLRAGLFAAPGKAYARIDAIEPLALLHLAQAIDGGKDQVPVWFGGRGRFHAHFDGHGRTTDSALFYD